MTNEPTPHHPFSARHIGKTHKANATTKFCQKAFQPILLQHKDFQHTENKK